MKALVLAAALTVGAGCATTWITTQATGMQRMWDEGIEETSVPLPGVSERLTVTLPLSTNNPLACSTDQRARDRVYHSAFRYGKQWKWMSGVMALLEGGLAAAFVTERDKKPAYVVYGGYFGVDALVTAALFFLPRKEVYREEDRPTLMHVRGDCPAGTTLVVGDARFPVDAAGGIGEQGGAALAAWMTAPSGALAIEVPGQSRNFMVSPGDRCTFLHARDPNTPPCTPGLQPSALVSLEVAAGTFANAEM